MYLTIFFERAEGIALCCCSNSHIDVPEEAEGNETFCHRITFFSAFYHTLNSASFSKKGMQCNAVVWDVSVSDFNFCCMQCAISSFTTKQQTTKFSSANFQQQKMISPNYSRTSMARTLMDRLPRLFRTNS